MIPGGDFNFARLEASAGVSCGGKWAAACKDWTKSSRGTLNATEDAMKGPAPAFVREDSMDDKGMVSMRPEVARVVHAGMGVLDHESEHVAPTRPEHWPLMVELSVEAMLAVDGEQMVHPRERFYDTARTKQDFL